MLYLSWVPYLYFLKTRLTGRFQRISWFFVYAIPSAILFFNLITFDNTFIGIFVFLTSFLFINYVYENGYIENDVFTVKKEESPTLRLEEKTRKLLEKNVIKISSIRLGVSISLLVPSAIFYSVKFAIGLLLVGVLLQINYFIYNRVRGRANLFLVGPLSFFRFYGVLLPIVFDVSGEAMEFCVALFLMYPFLKIIEFTKRARFGLEKIPRFVGDVDRFRVIYYMILSLFLWMFFGTGLLFYVSIYYLVYRFVSYLISKKSKMVKSAISGNFTRSG